MLAALRGSARRNALANGMQRVRGMATHAREYHGMEKVVRQYLPEDHHIVLANFASWIVIYGLYKVTRPSKSAEEPEPVVASTTTSDTEVPSIADEGFEEWAKIPGNLEKWEKSLEDWAKN